MKKFIVVSLMFFLFAGIGFAKSKPITVKGYILDNVCIKLNQKDLPGCAAKHTKECALTPACYESGYAVYTDEGKLIPLSKKATAKTRAYLKNTESSIKVMISGEKSGKYLDIITIQNQ
ncbi:MAG: hypothetical protein LHV68_08030 [Elusimicrobia bacterium]|nr:hypothetical protein [Candidatus Liberimonas magnetica]